MVCIAVYKNTRLRRTTSLYIIALAVSDLMSAVFVMPFALGVLITGEWVYGSVVCFFHSCFVSFVVIVSPVTMGLTAFDRYMRICKSEQQYKKIFSPWKPRAWLACAWFFIACYSAVPKLAGLQDYAFIPGYAICAVAHLSESGKIIHYTIVISCLFNTVNDNNIQLHKGCKDDPTAQCRNVIYDSQGRNRLKHHRARTEAE